MDESEDSKRLRHEIDLRVAAEAQAAEFCASREFFKSAYTATLDHAHKQDRRIAELEGQLADFTLKLREAHDAGAKAVMTMMQEILDSAERRGEPRPTVLDEVTRAYWAKRDAVIASKPH